MGVFGTFGAAVGALAGSMPSIMRNAAIDSETMGLAFGVTDLFMNAEAVAIEPDMRRPVFTAFHGCVSAGVAALAIGSSFISTMVGTWATGLIIVAAGVGTAAAFRLVWAGLLAALFLVLILTLGRKGLGK